MYDFDKGKFQTRLADFPTREEPHVREDMYLLVIFVILFIALALVTFSRFGQCLSQKLAANQ